MSSIDLIILGFLKGREMSAYEINQHIEAKKIKKWVKIGAPTVYQNIKKLASENYLTGKAIKVGEMPEKVIYKITESGEEYFLKLMSQFSSNPGKVYFDFNAFIVNLSFIDKKAGLEMLMNLRKSICDSKADVDADYEDMHTIVPSEGRFIMKQYQKIFKDIIQSLDEFIEEYKER